MKRGDLLSLLLCGVDLVTRPTLKNLIQGGGLPPGMGGADRRSLQRLEKSGLISASDGGGGEWVLALTERGRLQALGGRDPQQEWERDWDGRWGLLMFDLKMGEGSLRKRLHRWLHANRFGCLQKSVWIAAGADETLDRIVADVGEDAGAVITARVEAGGIVGASDAQIVSSAWPFDKINERYQTYIDFAKQGIPSGPTAEGALGWLAAEREAWEQAIGRDPLLPEELRPGGYLGPSAFEARCELFGEAAALRDVIREKS